MQCKLMQSRGGCSVYTGMLVSNYTLNTYFIWGDKRSRFSDGGVAPGSRKPLLVGCSIVKLGAGAVALNFTFQELVQLKRPKIEKQKAAALDAFGVFL